MGVAEVPRIVYIDERNRSSQVRKFRQDILQCIIEYDKYRSSHPPFSPTPITNRKNMEYGLLIEWRKRKYNEKSKNFFNNPKGEHRNFIYTAPKAHRDILSLTIAAILSPRSYRNRETGGNE